MAQKSKHQKILTKIHSKTGIDKQIISIIIKRFFWAVCRLMEQNKDVNIRSLFDLRMRKKYRNKLKSETHKIYQNKNNRKMYKKQKKKNNV